MLKHVADRVDLVEAHVARGDGTPALCTDRRTPSSARAARGSRRTRRGGSSGTGRRRAAAERRSRLGEVGQVAGQCRRVARDVGDRPRRSAAMRATTVAAGAGARRVEDDEVGARCPAQQRPQRPVDLARARTRDLRAGRRGCARRPRTARCVGLDREHRARRADRVGQRAGEQARRRRRGRAPARPAAGASPSSTASTSTSAAPGCTCQKPPRRQLELADQSPVSTRARDDVAARCARPCVHRDASAPGALARRAATTSDRAALRPRAARAPPTPATALGGDQAVVDRDDVVASGAGAGRPGPTGRPRTAPGCASPARRRRRAPARPSTSRSSPASRLQLLGDHRGLELALGRQVDVLPVAAAAAARARRTGTAAGDPVRATPRGPRRRRRAGTRSPALPSVTRDRPARPAARAGRRRPGPRDGRRSGRRARPGRPRPRRRCRPGLRGGPAWRCRGLGSAAHWPAPHRSGASGRRAGPRALGRRAAATAR